MELSEALIRRRSIRSFTSRPVERPLVDELIAAARRAPSSCNLQLTQYVVIDDPSLLSEFERTVSYKFAYAPVCIVVAYDTRFTVEHASAVMTAGMEVQNLLLKATELGLATCPLAGFSNDGRLKKRLGLPSHLSLLLLISLGYPKLAPSYDMPKLALEQARSYNGYGSLSTINGSPFLHDHTSQSVIDYRSRIAAVYLDRFRLRTYHDSCYQAAVDAFVSQCPTQREMRVLDLMSYDGTFIKLLAARSPETSITASDYLEHALGFFRTRLGCDTVVIDQRNCLNLQVERRFDYVTFIFQGEFTPQIDALLANAVAHLNEGGIFFVAWIEESSWIRLIKAARAFFRRWIHGRRENIYENNPFYRIGPRGEISGKMFDRLLREAGCLPRARGVALKRHARGMTVRWASYVHEQ